MLPIRVKRQEIAVTGNLKRRPVSLIMVRKTEKEDREETMDALFLIPGAVCMLLGGAFILLFRYSRREQEDTDRRLTSEAWGTLADIEERTEEDIDKRVCTRYYGIYEYDTADKQRVSAAAAFGYYSPEDVPGAQGELVNFLYDPNEPTKIGFPKEREEALSVWPKLRKSGIVLLVIGGILTAAAAAGLLGAFDALFENLLN